MTTDVYPRPRRDRTAAQRDRAAAFARIGRVRGLTIAGAGALSVAIAAAASASAHGHTIGAKSSARVTGPAPRTARAGATALRMPPLATPGQLGLRAPGAPPQAGSSSQGSSGSGPSAPQTQTQTQPSSPAPSQSSPPAATVPAPASPAPSSSGGVTSGGS